MDSTVIQEIANQLGMAVDQAGQFVTEQLPGYAALIIMSSVTWLIVAWVVFAFFAAASIITILMCKKKRREQIESGKDQCHPSYYGGYDTYKAEYWPAYLSFKVFIVLAIISVVCLVIAVTVSVDMIPKIIGWSNYPEAMLIDMALKAVG